MKQLREQFDAWYWWLARWITPKLVNAQRRYLDLLPYHLDPQTTWLDLGCGRTLLPAWIPNAQDKQRQLVAQAKVAVGLDLDHGSLVDNKVIPARTLGSSDRLPFRDCCFDLITANMVAEHLRDPIATLKEIARVLKPGGLFLVHTPNLTHPLTYTSRWLPQGVKNQLAGFFENRSQEDVFPTHYRFNTEAAVRRLAAQAGLGVDRYDLVESSPQTVMLGPLMVFEMFFTRLCRHEALRALRSNIITVLRKPALDGARPAECHTSAVLDRPARRPAARAA